METGEVKSGNEKTKVIILTNHYRIIGDIYLMPGARLTDYIIGPNSAIAVTDAHVSTHDGRLILSASFLNVDRNHIEVIIPADMAKLA
jgi:hypothetical protein